MRIRLASSARAAARRISGRPAPASTASVIAANASRSGVRDPPRSALSAYAAWVLVPAWTAYSRAWERLAAAFLSLYVLLTFAAIGVGIGAAVIWFWDRL